MATVPDGYVSLGTVGFTDKGDYSSSETYYINDLVHYNTAIYRCLVDDTTGMTPTNTSYWTKWLASGDSADGITVTDTSGIVGTAGESTDTQTLIDAIAAKVASNLVDNDTFTSTLASYLKTSQVVNNLTTTEEGYVLDARQGANVLTKNNPTMTSAGFYCSNLTSSDQQVFWCAGTSINFGSPYATYCALETTYGKTIRSDGDHAWLGNSSMSGTRLQCSAYTIDPYYLKDLANSTTQLRLVALSNGVMNLYKLHGSFSTYAALEAQWISDGCPGIAFAVVEGSSTSDMPNASETNWWNCIIMGVETRCVCLAAQSFLGKSTTGKLYLRIRHDSTGTTWYTV